MFAFFFVWIVNTHTHTDAHSNLTVLQHKPTSRENHNLELFKSDSIFFIINGVLWFGSNDGEHCLALGLDSTHIHT